MDSGLWELYEFGNQDDEVAAIIRLGHHSALPKGVRVVAQFSDIITARLKRSNIPAVSSAPEVASMVAGDAYNGPEVEITDVDMKDADLKEGSDYVVQPSDIRRPADQTATGRGVIAGFVDWGLDFAHPDFRNPDGSTRILALWDQRGGKRPDSPTPYGYGVVHSREAIDRALKQKDPYAALHYDPADADTGIGCHGTHVASIAAGSGGTDRPSGIAPEANLVFVHNSPWDEEISDKLGDSVTLLEGIDFIARTAGNRPWVINLSMGRHGEQHDGSTLIERGLDAAIRSEPGRAICMSAGNYFDKRIHASGQLRPTQERTFVWNINGGKPTDANQLEIWYSWEDKFEVAIRSPDGDITARVKIGEKAKLLLGGKEVGNIYHRGQEPDNLDNHITIMLYKEAPAGGWDVTIVGADVIHGNFHAWIEREVACPGCQSQFSKEDADPTSTTGTICNGRRTIAVGAYDRHDPERRIGHFSSVGPTRDGRRKPDLCAPGVSVLAARSSPKQRSGKVPLLTVMSGTSMAAPHVSGVVALMFQAAPRRLRIEETHNLLLESAERVSVPEDIPDRIGIGFLDVNASVEAARKVSAGQQTVKPVAAHTPVAPPVKAAPKADVEADEAYESMASGAIATESSVARVQTAPMDSVGLAAPSVSMEGTQAAHSFAQQTRGRAGDGIGSAAPTQVSAMEVSSARSRRHASTSRAETASVGGEASRVAPVLPSLELIELADQVATEWPRSRSSTPIMHEVFARSGLSEALTTDATGGLASPREIFEAFAYPSNAGKRAQFERNFDVIGLPRARLTGDLREGDILIRHMDGDFAHTSFIASPKLSSREALASDGLRGEGASEGYYVQVVDTGARAHGLSEGFARRITESTGLMPGDSMVLRLRRGGAEGESIHPSNNDRAAWSESPSVGNLPPTFPAAPGTKLPLDVELVAQLFVYAADDHWNLIDDPASRQMNALSQAPFSLMPLPGGEWFIPRMEVSINFGPNKANAINVGAFKTGEVRVLFEVRISNIADRKSPKTQAFFWRCTATKSQGISSIELLGAQPGRTPSSAFMSSPTGDSPVLGAIQGTVTPSSNASTRQVIQASCQIQGASSVLQLQGGLNFTATGVVGYVANWIKSLNLPVISGIVSPLSATVATQRTPQPPTYALTLTADIIAEGIEQQVPDALKHLNYYVNFANDSSTITDDETTKLLTWARETLAQTPHLLEGIRIGQIPLILIGKASVRGKPAHNFALSQHRLETVRIALQGGASGTGGYRSQGGVLGSENVKIDAVADGDFHDPRPSDIDVDRVVQIAIDGKVAAAAVNRLADGG
ncbi:hypothetical protein DWU98_11170 [Dyella monticola]|uniref:Peptidase S8/S53 domain-containing protein n=1 Tax=Dyella monticola TaxID=1927958 RepID=A0A370WY75_9GAMM|nr:S8 family serine peptidase [Dyella monticola]RDS81104.1 hypothetical protein DWU98_11170 [Dyella monticola]